MKHIEEKATALIMAAGRGSRMGAEISKQYLELGGKPVLAHTIAVFQECPWIDTIILVTEKEQTERVQKEIVDAGGFTKVRRVIAGGAERCLSVYKGLRACEDADYVYIQDGVRPFVTGEILQRAHDTVRKYGSAVCGMPVKDTIKRTDEDGVVQETPPRDTLWIVQTPQVFSYTAIREAYEHLMGSAKAESSNWARITDDATVLEMAGGKVHMFPGDYRNIKLTTPEDLRIAEMFLREKEADRQRIR